MSCNCQCSQYAPPQYQAGCTDCVGKCHEVVDTYADASYYHSAFVTVRDENSTYHVDEAGNPLLLSRNPLYSDTYVPHVGDYKSTIIYNFAVGEAYVFNPAGDYRTMPLIGHSGGGSSS